jgi:hypothetical protein
METRYQNPEMRIVGTGHGKIQAVPSKIAQEWDGLAHPLTLKPRCSFQRVGSCNIFVKTRKSPRRTQFPQTRHTNAYTRRDWGTADLWQNSGVLSLLLCMGNYFKVARRRFVMDATLFSCNLYFGAGSTTNVRVAGSATGIQCARLGRCGELRDVLEA